MNLAKLLMVDWQVSGNTRYCKKARPSVLTYGTQVLLNGSIGWKEGRVLLPIERQGHQGKVAIGWADNTIS